MCGEVRPEGNGSLRKMQAEIADSQHEQGLGVGPNDARWHQRGDSSVDI